jgi:phage gpG-like protein
MAPTRDTAGRFYSGSLRGAARFRIEIDGKRQLDLAFTGLGEDIGDWTEAWEKVAEQFYKSEKRHFRTYSFEPLSEAYAARKKKKYGNKPILRATDELWRGLTSNDAATSARIITPRSIALGSSHRAAGAHHNPKPGSRLPRRPLVDITAQDRRAFRSIIQRAATAKAKERGFRTQGVVLGELIQ